jgi:hypothetical protein
MPEWLAYANFALNLLLLPLLKILWHVKIDLARINGKIQAHQDRLDAIDRKHEQQAQET